MDEFDDCDDAGASAEPGPAAGLLPPWTAGESLWAYLEWTDDPVADDDDGDRP